jgi:multiple sugar transport system ATP-binding protein
MAAIELHNVTKSFQAVEVIHGIDLIIPDRSFTVFVGPSGCGKSTLLRMMAGLEEVTSGEIHIDGARCDHLMPSARSMAMVFQSYALYPHMSVAQNLRFGLENQRLPRAEIDERVGKAARILQIEHLLERRPNQLSGGQSQRVAIGRAIVKVPKAFLFDEPLSNLDAELRVKMRGELIELHRRLGSTMVYVTHDQVEAMTMADQIVVLNAGRVEQVGAPIDLYAQPRNLFVAGFIGAPQMNILKGQIRRKEAGFDVILGDGSVVPISGRRAELADGLPVSLGIRPEHAETSSEGVTVEAGSIEVLGAETIVHGSTTSGERLALSLRGISRVQPGDRVKVRLPPQFVHVFDANGAVIAPLEDWKAFYLS